ncbi:MAG: hypothetical protein U0531_09475 [Dehalococcoidia bacterium]
MEWWPLALVMLGAWRACPTCSTSSPSTASCSPLPRTTCAAGSSTMADIGLSPISSPIVGRVAGLVEAQAAIALGQGAGDALRRRGGGAVRFPRLRQV